MTIRIGLLIACVLLAGCGSVLSSRARAQNIRVVSHPRLVEGMVFVDGYTSKAGWIYGAGEVGNMAANIEARAGRSDLVVLVELMDAGQTYGQHSVGRTAVWQISIYQSPDETTPER